MKTAKTPVPRVSPRSFYSPGGETADRREGTWVEPECFAYPNGGLTRRAFVVIRRNPHNPVELSYGSLALVRCGIPDTYFTIPARLTVHGVRLKGFVSVGDDVFTFTPNADPDACQSCAAGEGCKRG